MRIINSYKLNLVLHGIFGDRLERLKEDFGLGWTLMVLARLT
jgi:hypothetical protein